VAVVMIGVDPHKGSRTAVTAGADEAVLAQTRVRASAAQAQRLLAWATAWPERTWAVEGAGGLGHLLAQEEEAAVVAGASMPVMRAPWSRSIGSARPQLHLAGAEHGNPVMVRRS
jgi:hypothetical protein